MQNMFNRRQLFASFRTEIQTKSRRAIKIGKQLTVKVGSHEDTSAVLNWALTAQTIDLAIVINLVVLEDGQHDLPVLVLDLLGGGVVVLLPLLGTSPQPEQGGLLLDVLVGQSSAIPQLLACKDKPLLIRRDSILVLDLHLHILSSVPRLHP